MNVLITNGIRITVYPFYEGIHKVDEENNYIFSYRVVIQNQNEEQVQLISRHWEIMDMAGAKRIVRGPGVIGQQPILNKTEQFEYQSFCPLTTPVGSMKGTYKMLNLDTQEAFQVTVPPFKMVAPFIKN